VRVENRAMMARMLLTRDPDRIKGMANLVLGIVLLAVSVAALIIGWRAVAIIVLVIACIDLFVAYLYTKRAGQILKRGTNPYSG
jgi:hypothetical protein